MHNPFYGIFTQRRWLLQLNLMRDHRHIKPFFVSYSSSCKVNADSFSFTLFFAGQILRHIGGLTLSGTKTHVKQRFLPLTSLLMVSDVLGHQFCQREGIMAGHIDMSVAKRGEACDIFIIKCFTLRPEMIQGCLHINSVP